MIMPKSVCSILLLVLSVFLLPACSKMQAPTSAGGITGSQSAGFGDIVPDGMDPMDWSAENGLEPRDASEGISDGMYNGREMITGVFPSVYFGFDSSSIGAAERVKLQQAADYLKANPTDGLLIEGHSDWYGTAEYNLALGDRRAASASSYLDTLGVSSLKVETLSKGSLEATSGLSKLDSAQDRRVDLIILK